MLHEQLILECLAKLEKVFGKKLEPEVRAIYVEHLQRLQESQFKAAMVRILAEFQPTSAKPFPAIADILGLCGESGQSKAVNILRNVKKAAVKLGQYPSVDFGDRGLHSVIQRYGGWCEIVMWGERDWQLHERNFIEAYKAADVSGLQGPQYLVGLHESSAVFEGQPYEKPARVDSRTGNILFMPQAINEIVAVRTKAESKKLENPAGRKMLPSMTVRERLRAFPKTPQEEPNVPSNKA